MSGQPTVFDFGLVKATETPAAGPLQPPAIIIQAGNSLMLRSYFHCGGTPFERGGVAAALAGAGAGVTYFCDDLEAGGTPVKIPGGVISKLTAAEITAAFGPGGDLEGSGLPPTDDYYRSADTAAITTGGGATLNIPAGRTSGTWRVLTYINGAAPFQVVAFDDNLLIQVTA